MKRRQALRSLMSLPAITALPGFAQQAATEKLPPELKPAPVEEFPKLAMTQAEAVLDATAHFFTGPELETLHRLCEILVPATNGKPGGLEAGAPEFLDFLISESPHDRQSLYRRGLTDLDAAAHQHHRKPFKDVSAAQAASLLAPLQTEWTFHGPADELGRFLHAAKEDVLRATLNSREWASAGTQRRSTGLNTYWFPIE